MTSSAALQHSLASTSMPSQSAKKFASLANNQLELNERDFWEDDADTSETEAVLASTSAPTLGLDHSSESEQDLEPPSPDIKAFHGEAQEAKAQTQAADHDNKNDDAPDAFPGFPSRRSTESGRSSMDSSCAMPIAGSVARRSRRPPLRANNTFANRDGIQRRASIKMGSSAPINIPNMSRLPFRDDDADDKKTPFVPPHLFHQSSKDTSVQQHVSILTGLSPGASVKREKLQQRNAILRRTGFLEGPPRVSGVGEVMDPIKESQFESAVGVEGLHSNPSALTAALGSSPAVDGS